MDVTTKEMSDAIHYAIRKEIERVVEDEIKKSQAEVERKVRARTGEIVTTIFDSMSFERFGTDLKITVSFPWRDLERNGYVRPQP